MSTQIDQFCEDLRVNMTMIDDNLRAVRTKALGKADEAERAARQQMDFPPKKDRWRQGGRRGGKTQD